MAKRKLSSITEETLAGTRPSGLLPGDFMAGNRFGAITNIPGVGTPLAQPGGAGFNTTELLPGQEGEIQTAPLSAIPDPNANVAPNILGDPRVGGPAPTPTAPPVAARPPAAQGPAIPRPPITSLDQLSAQERFRLKHDTELGSVQDRARRQKEREAAALAPAREQAAAAKQAQAHQQAIELKQAGPLATAQGALQKAQFEWGQKNAEAKAARAFEMTQNQLDRDATAQENQLDRESAELIANNKAEDAVALQTQKYKLQYDQLVKEGKIPGTEPFEAYQAAQMREFGDKLAAEGAMDAALAAYKSALDSQTKVVTREGRAKDKTQTTTTETVADRGTQRADFTTPEAVTQAQETQTPGDENNDGIIDERDNQIRAINEKLLNPVDANGNPLSSEALKKLTDRLSFLNKVK